METVYDVSHADFQHRVVEASRDRPVLVDFWADWCGPCKNLMPVLQGLAEEYAGDFALAKVDTDREQALAQEQGVRSLPTVKLFRHGKAVDGFVGVQPESVVRQLIERYRVTPAERLLEAARRAEAEGDAPGALNLLQQAHQADPDHVPARTALARALARREQLDEARRLLEGLPPVEREGDAGKTLEAELNLLQALHQAPESEALEQRLAADPRDAEAGYFLAVRRYFAGDPEQALDGLLNLMLSNLDKDRARQGLLDIFQLLGPEHPLVKTYRRRMALAMH